MAGRRHKRIGSRDFIVEKPKKIIREPTLREIIKKKVAGSSGQAAQAGRKLAEQKKKNRELLGN